MDDCSIIEFDSWLKEKLIKLNTDDEIFSPYIKGILDTDDTEEEKNEALQGIISEITNSNIEPLCSEIIAKWSNYNSTSASTTESTANNRAAALDNRLAQLLEQQASCITRAAPRHNTAERAELKQAILAQYAQVSGDEGEEEETTQGAVGGTVAKNTNAAAVEQELQQKREQNKLEHKMRKDKDKLEREKQKAKAEERKDKEKKRTQKGERRR